MKTRLYTVFLLVLFSFVNQTVLAKNIMCWQNKQKVRECGETVPPEYAQQRIEVLNDQGIIIKVIHARKTRAQLAQEEQQAQKQAAENERRRQDIILLKTYTSEQEMQASRDKKLTTIDGNISIVNGNIRILTGSLEHLQKQAANHERSGSKVPAQLLNDITSTKKQIVATEQHLNETMQRRSDIVKQYEKDLARYRELKGSKTQ